MPTILYKNGFRFFFWSEEGNELPHIHISKADGIAKYWLIPHIKCEYSYGFTAKENRFIRETIKNEYNSLIYTWYEYHKR